MSLISGLTGGRSTPTPPPQPWRPSTEVDPYEHPPAEAPIFNQNENMPQAVYESLMAQGVTPSSVSESGQYWGNLLYPGGGGGTSYPVDFDPIISGGLSIPSGPSTPSTPTGITWEEFDSRLAGPDWWKALKPSEMNAQTEQLASLNLLIPLLSPEDQRQVAQFLYNTDPTTFAHLNPEHKPYKTPTPNVLPPGIPQIMATLATPTPISPSDPSATPKPIGKEFFPPANVGRGIREKFQSENRSKSGLAALTRLAEATGTSVEEMGSGTQFLRNILDQIGDFTGQGQQSRQQYMEMMGSITPTMSGASEAQEPFKALARMLSQPFFSTGNLMNVSKNEQGQYVFGKANKGLYF